MLFAHITANKNLVIIGRPGKKWKQRRKEGKEERRKKRKWNGGRKLWPLARFSLNHKTTKRAASSKPACLLFVSTDQLYVPFQYVYHKLVFLSSYIPNQLLFLSTCLKLYMHNLFLNTHLQICCKATFLTSQSLCSPPLLSTFLSLQSLKNVHCKQYQV